MDETKEFSLNDHNAITQENKIPVQVNMPFGNYTLLEKIGLGAMGVVYKAHHRYLKRTVALKIPTNANNEEVKRFLREAETMAQLKHPNIVNIYEVGSHNHQPYLTMELIEGQNLEEYIKKRTLPFKESIAIVINVCDAIEYAHKKGIIHRDLKPSNIMLCKNKPIVMDFGLAKKLDDQNKISQTGAILGTIKYMSPEQAQGKNRKVNEQSDIYSLGVILYELITGRVPFSRGSSYLLLHDIVKIPPISPREIKSKIPKDLENICLKALMKKPMLRYQTAKEFADDLRNFIKGEAVVAKTVKKSWFAKNPSMYISVCIFSTCVAILMLITVLIDNNSLYIKNEEIRQKNKVLTNKTDKYQVFADKLYKKSFQSEDNDFESLYAQYSLLKECYDEDDALYNLGSLHIKISLEELEQKVLKIGLAKVGSILQEAYSENREKLYLKAFKYCQKMKSIAPENAQLCNIFASSLFRILDYDSFKRLDWKQEQIIEVLKKSAELNSTSHWAQLDYGSYLTRIGDERGFEKMHKAIDKTSSENRVWMYLQLAKAYLNKKDYRKALEYYEKEIEIESSRGWLIYESLNIRESKYPDEIVRFCQKLHNKIKKNPDDWHYNSKLKFYDFYTLYFFSKNKWKSAIRIYRIAIELFPDYFYFHYGLALCCARDGRRRKAREHSRICMEILSKSQRKEHKEIGSIIKNMQDIMFEKKSK